MKEEKIKLSVYIDKHIHDLLKLEAQYQGRNITEIAKEVFAKFLKETNRL